MQIAFIIADVGWRSFHFHCCLSCSAIICRFVLHAYFTSLCSFSPFTHNEYFQLCIFILAMDFLFQSVSLVVAVVVDDFFCLSLPFVFPFVFRIAFQVGISNQLPHNFTLVFKCSARPATWQNRTYARDRWPCLEHFAPTHILAAHIVLLMEM